jgi:hypothetical protein
MNLLKLNLEKSLSCISSQSIVSGQSIKHVIGIKKWAISYSIFLI